MIARGDTRMDELVSPSEWGAVERVASLLERLDRKVRQPRHLISRVEAARRLGLVEGDEPGEDELARADRTVMEMVRADKLRGVRVGRIVMVDPKSLEDFIDGGGG